MKRYKIICLECGEHIANVESVNAMSAFTDYCSEIGWNPLHFATIEGTNTVGNGIATEGTVCVEEIA